MIYISGFKSNYSFAQITDLFLKVVNFSNIISENFTIFATHTTLLDIITENCPELKVFSLGDDNSGSFDNKTLQHMLCTLRNSLDVLEIIVLI